MQEIVRGGEAQEAIKVWSPFFSYVTQDIIAAQMENRHFIMQFCIRHSDSP